jgi:hypothetical protein
VTDLGLRAPTAWPEWDPAAPLDEAAGGRA